MYICNLKGKYALHLVHVQWRKTELFLFGGDSSSHICHVPLPITLSVTFLSFSVCCLEALIKAKSYTMHLWIGLKRKLCLLFSPVPYIIHPARLIQNNIQYMIPTVLSFQHDRFVCSYLSYHGCNRHKHWQGHIPQYLDLPLWVLWFVLKSLHLIPPIYGHMFGLYLKLFDFPFLPFLCWVDRDFRMFCLECFKLFLLSKSLLLNLFLSLITLKAHPHQLWWL